MHEFILHLEKSPIELKFAPVKNEQQYERATDGGIVGNTFLSAAFAWIGLIYQ